MAGVAEHADFGPNVAFHRICLISWLRIDIPAITPSAWDHSLIQSRRIPLFPSHRRFKNQVSRPPCLDSQGARALSSCACSNSTSNSSGSGAPSLLFKFTLDCLLLCWVVPNWPFSLGDAPQASQPQLKLRHCQGAQAKWHDELQNNLARQVACMLVSLAAGKNPRRRVAARREL